MPPRLSRRRGADEEATPTQRRRRDDTPEEDEDVDMEDDEQESGSGSVEQLSKGLVRYAISCEHSRKPIKRQDINEKVLGSHTRLFKDVFSRANAELKDVFGMELVELPKAERVTVRQKRAANASESQGKSSNLWVLQTTLPDQYRLPDIIGPSRPLPDDELNKEDSYVGLYTMTIALITIAGGKIPEGKLDRALRRMNADQSTPMGSKDKTLALMAKDGYIVAVKEDEAVDYIIGPRGKVEVGHNGFANLVRMLYGEEQDQEELEKRIERTLNIADAFNNSGVPVESAPAASQTAGRKRGRPRRDEDSD
ncbi:MAGE-domain-containing protein [Ophiobolus disseminans]|uniref:MAGE-domain-containing protein n=1 Tax=Ophiobolus disseminans TaxID=1469910 RepID=A0A6A6ZU72_9PLEO|nr:MAGE-domain-containing protein [Ophiobolus disseminans]